MGKPLGLSIISMGLPGPVGRISFRRRPTAMSGMRTFGVIEVEPLANHPLGNEAVGHFMQVDRLVFKAGPQAFDKDVVHAAAPAIHRDGDLGLLENAGEVEAGELAALIGVEDFRLAVSG